MVSTTGFEGRVEVFAHLLSRVVVPYRLLPAKANTTASKRHGWRGIKAGLQGRRTLGGQLATGCGKRTAMLLTGGRSKVLPD